MEFVVRVKGTSNYLCKDRKSFKHAVLGPLDKALVFTEKDCIYEDDIAEDEEAVMFHKDGVVPYVGSVVSLPSASES